MVLITINNVDCYYDSSKALENVKLEIKKGDFIGIIGPNGSGKTTLLRAISGTLKPKRGAVFVEN
ncbi:MAG TPA: ABC transporter ATP-binding protein, partial [Nitrososphaerales archaeon]